MTPAFILTIVIIYFLVLISISYLTSRKSDENSFFTGDKSSPWYIVAFGMIGASLSGVTFISIPGWVDTQQFAYMQIVFGYLFGYFVIALILMPIYYQLNLTSIYDFLRSRFGKITHKTGTSFFLVSRVLGASFRLYLVVWVLQEFLFEALGISFWQTTLISILLIWVYTFKSGIKTVIWTDTLQTLFMLGSLFTMLYLLTTHLNLSFGDVLPTLSSHNYSKIFFFDDFKASNYFWKHFIGGMFIAISMTGLDQDMMQKNLTCKSLKDAQKNMFWFSIILVFVNLLFLMLGGLLFLYAQKNQITVPVRTDLLFPTIALQNIPETFAGVIFLLGLIAAAYSSADSALTALTTSFCFDILEFKKEENNTKKRYIVHVGFSLLVFITIQIFNNYLEQNVIHSLLKIASYTYGPLLGLFAFGIFSKQKVTDSYLVVLICLISPSICFALGYYSKELFNGYSFGHEMLIVNGLITYVGLWLISYKSK